MYSEYWPATFSHCRNFRFGLLRVANGYISRVPSCKYAGPRGHDLQVVPQRSQPLEKHQPPFVNRPVNPGSAHLRKLGAERRDRFDFAFCRRRRVQNSTEVSFPGGARYGAPVNASHIERHPSLLANLGARLVRLSGGVVMITQHCGRWFSGSLRSATGFLSDARKELFVIVTWAKEYLVVCHPTTAIKRIAQHMHLRIAHQFLQLAAQ